MSLEKSTDPYSESFRSTIHRMKDDLVDAAAELNASKYTEDIEKVKQHVLNCGEKIDRVMENMKEFWNRMKENKHE